MQNRKEKICKIDVLQLICTFPLVTYTAYCVHLRNQMAYLPWLLLTMISLPGFALIFFVSISAHPLEPAATICPITLNPCKHTAFIDAVTRPGMLSDKAMV